MTEAILHGYQIILLPRKPPCLPEVVITAPYTKDTRYTRQRLDLREKQLVHELEVVRAAQKILASQEPTP
jgi:hypothetical protein